jgi:hypothetical protein
MTIEDIRKLLSKNITITLFAGDADYNCNWLGGEVVAQEVNHNGYSEAGYTNLITSDHIKVGFICLEMIATFADPLVLYSTAKPSKVVSFPLVGSTKVVMKYPSISQSPP